MRHGLRYVLSRAAAPAAASRPLMLALMLALAPGLPAGLLVGANVAMAADPDSSGSNGAVTMYRWVDAQGVVHYSDTPQPGAQKLEIAPAQTFQSTPTQAAGVSSQPAPADGDYTGCVITQPQSQQSFYAPESVPVSVQLAPGRRPGDRVQVTVDGQSVSPTDDSGTNFQIDMPDRGQHTVAAAVLDSDGKTVCTAQTVIFYVQRPSLLSPHPGASGHGSLPIAAGH